MTEKFRFWYNANEDTRLKLSRGEEDVAWIRFFRGEDGNITSGECMGVVENVITKDGLFDLISSAMPTGVHLEDKGRLVDMQGDFVQLHPPMATFRDGRDWTYFSYTTDPEKRKELEKSLSRFYPGPFKRVFKYVGGMARNIKRKIVGGAIK